MEWAALVVQAFAIATTTLFTSAKCLEVCSCLRGDAVKQLKVDAACLLAGNADVKKTFGATFGKCGRPSALTLSATSFRHDAYCVNQRHNSLLYEVLNLLTSGCRVGTNKKLRADGRSGGGCSAAPSKDLVPQRKSRLGSRNINTGYCDGVHGVSSQPWSFRNKERLRPLRQELRDTHHRRSHRTLGAVFELQ